MYPSLTPYHYCANNPLKFVDPDGKEITNPQGYILSNPQVLMLLVALDQEIGNQKDLQSEDFTIEITGGDRYKKSDGKMYSRMTDKEIKSKDEKSKRSSHLEKRGARGFDLAIRKGNINKDDVKKAANTLGIEQVNIEYDDNHIHLGLPWGYGIALKEWFIKNFKPFNNEAEEENE